MSIFTISAYLIPAYGNNDTNQKTILKNLVTGSDFLLLDGSTRLRPVNVDDLISQPRFEQLAVVTVRYSKQTKKFDLTLTALKKLRSEFLAEKKRLKAISKPLTFDGWIKKVDAIISKKTGGYGLSEFSDRYPLADSYDDGLTPENFVDEYFSGDLNEILLDDLFG